MEEMKRTDPALTWSSPGPEDAAAIQGLFEQTSWAKGRSIQGIRKMLEQSGPVVGVWRGGVLVGFGRAVTDGVFRALLDDIVIDKGERSHGLGSEVVKRLIAELGNIEELSLSCGLDVSGFYERLGFARYNGAHMKRKANNGVHSIPDSRASAPPRNK
jgi:GNAT superfamily N-acetyltransferase